MALNNEQQALLGRIALLLQKPVEDVSCDSPTEEELALMLEGKLDVVRRAQIISCLAADNELYKTWIALIEDFDFDAEPQAQHTQEQSLSLFERLKRLFSLQAPWPQLGGAVAVAVLVIPLYLGQDPYQLSPHYGRAGDMVLSDWQLPASKSLNWQAPSSEWDQVRTGARYALAQLELDPEKVAATEIPYDKGAPLMALGEVLILTDVACQSGYSADLFQSSYSDIYQELSTAADLPFSLPQQLDCHTARHWLGKL